MTQFIDLSTKKKFSKFVKKFRKEQVKKQEAFNLLSFINKHNKDKGETK